MTSTTRSAVYVGHLLHVRSGAVANRFRYRVSFAALDVDEIPMLAARLALFSHNRQNVYSLHDADYQDGSDGGLRGSIERFVRARGVTAPVGRIALITQLRAFGWVFNPVSFFVCHRDDSTSAPLCTIAEVNNTYGQTHRYLLDSRNQVANRPGCHRTAKQLAVSPFFDDDHEYEWDLRSTSSLHAPERHDLRVRLRRGDRVALAAALTGTRRELCDLGLLKLLWTHPLMPQQIISLIHWQAIKLRARGLQYRPAPIDDTAHSFEARPARRAGQSEDHLAPRSARSRDA